MDGRNPAPPVNSIKKRRNTDPLRARGYLHLDERPPRSHIEARVSDPDTVSRWQFLPLLRLTKTTRKIRSKDAVTRTFKVKEKKRPICYASHQDAALYATYAANLTARYEQLLLDEGLEHCVTAFRTNCGKCNIHYALEAFTWIHDNAPCVALAYDVSSFFDELDHHILKAKWCEVLGMERMPADHFAVYRAITRFSLIDRDPVYALFSISRHTPFSNGRRRICSPNEFREKIASAGLIESNKNCFGIPQGTPISAVLSNIYMLDFDRVVSQAVAGWGGLYRRYCDDILLVVPPHFAEGAKRLVGVEIEKAKLRIHADKLDERFFEMGEAIVGRPLQYLGLTFDGVRILLRTGGISRFYAQMRGGVRRAHAMRRKNARRAGTKVADQPINRKKLNKNYTYLGSRNFISYALRASSAAGDLAIRRQLSKHWMKLGEAIARMNAQLSQ